MSNVERYYKYLRKCEFMRKETYSKYQLEKVWE